MNRATAAAVVLGCACSLAGCQTTGPVSSVECRSVEVARGSTGPLLAAVNSPHAARVPGANSVLIVPTLGGRIAVSQAEVTRTVVDNPAVRLELANCSNAEIRLRARTQFMDASGRPTEPISAWKEVVLLPHSVAGYDELGVQRPGTHFRVELDRTLAGTP